MNAVERFAVLRFRRFLANASLAIGHRWGHGLRLVENIESASKLRLQNGRKSSSSLAFASFVLSLTPTQYPLPSHPENERAI